MEEVDIAYPGSSETIQAGLVRPLSVVFAVAWRYHIISLFAWYFAIPAGRVIIVNYLSLY